MTRLDGAGLSLLGLKSSQLGPPLTYFRAFCEAYDVKVRCACAVVVTSPADWFVVRRTGPYAR